MGMVLYKFFHCKRLVYIEFFIQYSGEIFIVCAFYMLYMLVKGKCK
jgi:hypothetical protein